MKLLFTFSLIFITSSLFGQTVIDRIAVQIGDKAILLSDIQQQKLQAIQAGMAATPEFDCQILEELMYQKLLINQADIDSVYVTDEQIDSEMESRLRVIENQIGGRDKMEQFYGKTVTQIKNEFRPVIGDQLRAQEMERSITEGVTVTPREVSEFFAQIPLDSLPLINTQLSFQQIVIYPEITPDDKKRAIDKLNEIRLDIIENGKSFATQARIHSMDPGSAANGGLIQGTKGMMVKPFEATVFALQEGEVSDVFESQFGYHIVKLEDRKGDDYTCRHILIIPEFANSALEKAALRLDTCYQEIKANKITWDAAVIKYSNDESTKQNKGIITNPTTGEQTWDAENLNQIDQQIYLLTDGMVKGDISEPNLYTNLFERKQGVRIVRLMDRTSPHRANLKDDYSLIQRATENDKKQRAINKWVKSKIAQTYIKLNAPYDECEFVNPWKKN